ncbi:MAG: sigma-70 family RNA polymerase sigma factor [Burkholderiales bacterium]|nr:sigma-70 family RNA polymerase sigma factor [Phycisphaerae bacterium]
MPVTDSELLEQYSHHGSNEAMCELARRHSGMVRAAALRELHDPHAADDVVQAVFLVLMRKARGLPRGVVIGGWLFKTTMYAVANMRRQQSRRIRHEREAGHMKYVDEAALAAADDTTAEELVQALNNAINRLSAAHRDVIVLRYLEGRSMAEVAAMLAVNLNTLRQRLFRAVEKLRKHLRHSGLTVTATGLTAALESSMASTASTAIPAPLETLFTGTAPAEHIQTLATGVMKMANNTKWAMAATTAAGVMLVVGVAMTVALAQAEGPTTSPVATTAPAVGSDVPAASQLHGDAGKTKPLSKGPQATPKETAVAAFRAASIGDKESWMQCFTGLTEKNTDILEKMVRMHGLLEEYQLAMLDKFGNRAHNPLDTGNDSPQAILSAAEAFTESIHGDEAVVDLATFAPKSLRLVKIGTVWKIDAARFPLPPTAAVFGRDERRIPVLRDIIANVKAGKYANFEEAEKALTDLWPPRR